MKWTGRRESSNVERSGPTGTQMAIGGGGIGGVLLVLLVLFLGGDPSAFLPQEPQQDPGRQKIDPKTMELEKFVSVVLADTEEVWHDLFRKHLNKQYREPKMVLFRGNVKSACGFAQAAMGPFYCPSDEKVYLDLTFFTELRNRFKAPGDFAQAYVIAHEVGHHVQKLLGKTQYVHSKSGQISKTEYNKLSVRLELQADFLAGVWAHHAQQRFNMLEPGDIEEALTAANAIGDDRLQMESKGYVVPDSFNHGTSKQRVYWFRQGFETGDLNKMNELFTRDYNSL